MGHSVPEGGRGEWGAEKPVLAGEPVNDEDELSDRRWIWGSCKVTEGEVYSGSSSSLMRCSRRSMFSRNNCVLVLPLPSSY